MSKDIIDKNFKVFLNNVESQEKQKNIVEKNKEEIRREKNLILMPIKLLLKRIEDTGVMVWDSQRFSRGMLKSDARKLPARQLKVYEDESGPMCQPGKSLYLKHPADIEISVPNDKDKEKNGLIQISCSENPHKGIFNKTFRNVEDACEAIVDFLSKNTISIMSNEDANKDNDIDDMIDNIKK